MGSGADGKAGYAAQVIVRKTLEQRRVCRWRQWDNFPTHCHTGARHNSDQAQQGLHIPNMRFRGGLEFPSNPQKRRGAPKRASPNR